ASSVSERGPLFSLRSLRQQRDNLGQGLLFGSSGLLITLIRKAGILTFFFPEDAVPGDPLHATDAAGSQRQRPGDSRLFEGFTEPARTPQGARSACLAGMQGWG